MGGFGLHLLVHSFAGAFGEEKRLEAQTKEGEEGG
jgi:hypothetical protein